MNQQPPKNKISATPPLSPLKTGYTTGSSAAAAAAGAVLGMLGDLRSVFKLETPCGEVVDIELFEIVADENSGTCFVVKDAGDDPDVTHGTKVHARVTKNPKLKPCEVNIFGGVGVGVVTKPGLDQPVGAHAINSVPRKMITKAVSEILENRNCDFGVDVEISIPKGVELAKKTFNPKLGIVGGISVLGTSGIVHPMSDKAIVDTIKVEISQKIAMGCKNILITPGNYGQTFLEGEFKLSKDVSVKCSNFIGETFEILKEKSAETFLLVGHIGKIVKLYNNAFNTHSKYGDGRGEAFADASEKANLSADCIQKVKTAVSTDEMISILKAEGKSEEVIEILAKKIEENIKRKQDLPFALMIFSNVHGLLYKSENAKVIFDKILEENND